MPRRRLQARLLVGALTIAGLTAPAPVRAYTPPIEYALNCRGCHLADGSGTVGGVPALAGSVSRFLSVPGGRDYLVRVPGVSQAPLDDASLAAVMNWLVREFDPAHLPADFRPFTANEVARLRGMPLVDVSRERNRLLAEFERSAGGGAVGRAIAP